jgi:hypothetical protein
MEGGLCIDAYVLCIFIIVFVMQGGSSVEKNLKDFEALL